MGMTQFIFETLIETLKLYLMIYGVLGFDNRKCKRKYFVILYWIGVAPFINETQSNLVIYNEKYKTSTITKILYITTNG